MVGLDMERTEIKEDGVVVWNDGNQNTDAWVEDGGRTWFLDSVERKMKPRDLWNLIKSTWQNGKFYRCSGCGLLMPKDKVVGWPLFSGVTCGPCQAKHDESTQEQIKKGHVCRMCGKPYNNCCC